MPKPRRKVDVPGHTPRRGQHCISEIQKDIIVRGTIAGKTQTQIAIEAGTRRETVNMAVNRSAEIKGRIEAIANRIIMEGGDLAASTLINAAKYGEKWNAKTVNKDLLKISVDASKHITGISGLSGSNQSTIINTLIQVNEAPQQTAELAALSAFLAQQWGLGEEANVIDVNDVLTDEGEK